MCIISFFTLYVILKMMPYIDCQIPINYLIICITCVLVSLFVFVGMIISERISTPKSQDFLGKISYEIYLYHLLVAEIIWCFL